MILLTLRDLQHRAMRFAVVTLLGAVLFTLLFIMTGIAEQFHREPGDTVRAFAAPTWVLPTGVGGPFTSSGTISSALAAEVSGEGAAPAVISRNSVTADGETREVILVGHLPDALGSPPTFQGRAATSPGEVVVDRSIDARVGDQVFLAGQPFEVVGRSDRTTMFAGVPLAFVVLPDAQQLSFQNDAVVNLVLVAGGEVGTPPGTVAVSEAHVIADSAEPLKNAITSIDIVRYLLWLVAGISIGSVIYLSALERLRDFAVLKAIGASNRSLMTGLAIQAVLVALVAVVIAMVLQRLLSPVFPLTVSVPNSAYWQIPVLSVVMALVAAAAGMRRASSSDPALAFAGAGA